MPIPNGESAFSACWIFVVFLLEIEELTQQTTFLLFIVSVATGMSGWFTIIPSSLGLGSRHATLNDLV